MAVLYFEKTALYLLLLQKIKIYFRNFNSWLPGKKASLAHFYKLLLKAMAVEWSWLWIHKILVVKAENSVTWAEFTNNFIKFTKIFVTFNALYFRGCIKQNNETNLFSIQLLSGITFYFKIIFYALIIKLFAYESYKKVQHLNKIICEFRPRYF